PDRPQGQEPVSRFASRDWGDAYLERLRGFVVPPVDGEYVFWIAGDDECELWLSEDDTRTRLRRIAHCLLSSPEEWEKSPDQRSAPIVLTHGRRYYVEALHKEGGGEDHVSVSWRLPDGTLERPIPGAHLSPPTEPVPPGAAVASSPPPVAPTPAAPSMLVLWNGDNLAGGSGYSSTGITKIAGCGRDGSTGLQATIGTDFANLGWNWFS
ncbi:MAG TPA: PA14 domain-containing protein, partial [Planctomycetota bacterium]|nr:PA14 domain-containing protein [Planctomycetota bacterium]